MMLEDIKKHICERLLDIRNRVKNIHLTYIYEKELEYHTIIVEPTEVFEKDSLFHRLEKDLMASLFDKYGISDVLFTEKVPYIAINEEEVILRLAASNIKEALTMTFNYDKLNMPSFNCGNQKFGELISYALAA